MTKYNYTRKVINAGGFIVMTPEVSSLSELKTQSTINPYAESATQEWPLGTKLINGERVWRYCYAGATGLNIAAPIQSSAAAHAEQDDDIVCGAVAAIGALTVEVTSTANLAAAPNATINNFAEGYLIVNDVVGESQCYKIKSNEALAGTADSTFTLYDPLITALDTTSQLGIIPNPYKNVIATAAVITGVPVGIPQFAITANYYFWSQTGGPAAAIAQAAITKGEHVIVGTTAAKVNEGTGVATETIIGIAMTPGVADTESMIVFLTLDR